MNDRSTQMLDSADHPVQQCRGILLRQLACALEYLERNGGADVNVHGARKQLKRARATLRLLRPAIGDEVYGRENAAARDAARPLSQVRDAEVLTAALDGLRRRLEAAASGLTLSALQARLQHRHQEIMAQQLRPRELAAVRNTLQHAAARVRGLKIADDEWKCIAAGLRATYRRGRRALRKAHEDRSTETLHDWRKQAKYLWHQLQTLTPLAAGSIGELADEFHLLADYLGDEHDLAVLREQAVGDPHEISAAARSALQALIDRHRAEFQAKAFALGERLYADKPNAFLARFTKYWRQWARQREEAPQERLPLTLNCNLR